MNLNHWSITCIIALSHFSCRAFANSFSMLSPLSEDAYEFCADHQFFTFSYQACPGGVLLKKPMTLTEPCDCINKNLKIYSPCEPSLQINLKNRSQSKPRKVCRPTEKTGVQKKVIMKLVLPLQRNTTAESKDLDDPVCQMARFRASCSRHYSRNFHYDPNHPSTKMLSSDGHVRGRRVLPALEHHRDKREAKSASNQFSVEHVTDPKLRQRIEETISYLNEIQFGKNERPGETQPNSLSFRVLEKTVEIYNNIAPSIIIEDGTLNSILDLFMKKYSNLEFPGYSGKLYVDDHINEQSFSEVISRLNECASRSVDSSQELEFISAPDLCPAEITHVIHRAKEEDFGFRKVKHELGKLMPQDRKYVVEKEDFILGALWKVFDTVYSYCYSYTFNYHNAQIMVFYHNIIKNIFTSPNVFPDYNVDGGTSMYSSRIQHEDLSVLMKNMDLMDEAVHILSKFKPFFVKPLSEIKETNGAPPPAPAPKQNKRAKRQRRSTFPESNEVDWSLLEIWNGRAYCLQTSNPDLPASIANAYPNIDEMLCD